MWIRGRAFDLFTRHALDRLDYLVGRITRMATQADINRLTQQIDTASGNITTAVDGIRKDIEDLKNQGVDTAALEASVAQLDQQVGGLSALDAENPAQPPVEPV